MSANTPSPSATPAPSKQPRSPTERKIVWGGIVVLLTLVAVQAHARFGYEMSLKKLQARLASDDDGSLDGSPLLISDVRGMLVGMPSKTVKENDRHWHSVTYTWHGLGKSYSIHMPYDSSEAQPVVLSLETNDAPPPQTVELPVNTADSDPGNSLPAADDAVAGGGGGGAPGRGRNIMDSDKDGDGKVSKEEASERVAQNWDQWDTNADGFIDADEATAFRERMRAQREGGNAPAAETPVDAAAAVKAVATEADAKPAEEKKGE